MTQFIFPAKEVAHPRSGDDLLAALDLDAASYEILDGSTMVSILLSWTCWAIFAPRDFPAIVRK